MRPRRWKHSARMPARARLPEVDWEAIKAEIRAALNVADLAAADGVSFKGGAAAGWRSARCPFHSDGSPSFRANAEGWICHAGCGQGDVFDYLAKRRGLEAAADGWREVLHEAAELAGVELPSVQAPTLGSLRLRLGSAGGRVGGMVGGVVRAPDFDNAVSHDNAAGRLVLHEVADIMRWREAGELGEAWLRGRGLSAHAAQVMGVADPAAPARWLDLVHGAERAGLIAAGLARELGEGERAWMGPAVSSELVRWCEQERVRLHPLAVAGCGGAGGLAWPICHPDHEHPVSWRFRPYERGKGPKVWGSYAMPSGHHALPLGLWSALWRTPQPAPLAVVVCEGEADWLSVVDVALAAAELGDGLVAGWHVVPIGITSMSGVATHGLPAAAAELLAAADALVCLVDVGNALPGQAPKGEAVALAILDQWREGGRASDAGWCPLLLDDDDDANDLHKRGELSKLLHRELPAHHTTRQGCRIEKVSA